MLSAKQGSHWYHFYNVFGMTRPGIDPTPSWPTAHEADALPLELSRRSKELRAHTYTFANKLQPPFFESMEGRK